MDRIDQLLGCISLRWHGTGGELDELHSGKKDGLIPVKAIRGSVCLVPRNPSIIENKMNYSRLENHYRIYDDAARCENKLLYPNRFFNTVDERFSSGEHQCTSIVAK